MIELVDAEPEVRGRLVMLADFRRAPERAEDATGTYVDERARWNDLARGMDAAELAEAVAIVDAWRTARRRVGRR